MMIIHPDDPTFGREGEKDNNCMGGLIWILFVVIISIIVALL